MRCHLLVCLTLLAACRRGGDDAAPATPAAAAPAPAGDHAGHAGHAAATDHSAHGGATDHSAHDALPAGHAEVAIATDRQQAIGLRLATVTRDVSSAVVRASATVQPDERRDAHVHSRLMGYVRTLHVNTVGQKVRKGQALYTLYAQDLLVAQQEYLRARSLSPELAAAARERLRLWDIPDDQIAALEARGAPLEEVTVRAPISGTVIEKTIVRGHYVEPDMMLYRIADLSEVWVVADVYEFELARIDRTAAATIRLEGRSDTLTAPIAYIHPTVDTATRTVKVRMTLKNPTGELRPGSFATVELPVTAASALSVPDEAVIDTGAHQLVYVATGPTTFRPVEVHVVRRAAGRAEIHHGLAEGDQVVASAQFLVDSESRLRATGAPAGHGGH